MFQFDKLDALDEQPSDGETPECGASRAETPQADSAKIGAIMDAKIDIGGEFG